MYRTTMKKFCCQCGANVQGLKFCASCGAPQQQLLMMQQPAQQTTSVNVTVNAGPAVVDGRCQRLKESWKRLTIRQRVFRLVNVIVAIVGFYFLFNLIGDL